jgi:hypothetical protein
MKLDQARCNGIYRIVSRQSSLHLCYVRAHHRAIIAPSKKTDVGPRPVEGAEFMCLPELEEFPQVKLMD